MLRINDYISLKSFGAEIVSKNYNSIFSVGRVVYLHNFFVFKEFRSQGKGTKLIKAAMEMYKEQLNAQVFVAICSNPRSYRAFIKAGFVLIKELPYASGDFPGIPLMSEEFKKEYEGLWVVMKRN